MESDRISSSSSSTDEVLFSQSVANHQRQALQTQNSINLLESGTLNKSKDSEVENAFATQTKSLAINGKRKNGLKKHPYLNGIQLKHELTWDAQSKSECISLTEDNKCAYFFHDPYTISRGTAGVRGNQELKEGITYFEVLVKEPLYGTAVMIGVGTTDVNLHYSDFEYVNLVGKDENSWGLCHKGTIWHKNKSASYCSPFFHKDTTVGVLYDSYRHTLHFFINHVYMGVAFENVNTGNKKLYPIISSTATDIELELTRSFRLIYSLQDLCCQFIASKQKRQQIERLPLAKSLIEYLNEF